MGIDESIFEQSENVQAIRVPKAKVGMFLKHPNFSEFIWTRRGQKSVHPDPVDQQNYRVVLLNDALPADLAQLEDTQMMKFAIKTSYTDFSTEEVLRVILKDFPDPPSSFETIGHIAHMNLRDEFLPHKELIGQVILDKNPHIRTVVTKVGTLSNEYRTFDMEIIACRDNDRSLIATVSERKLRFLVDYQKSYWNSRLATERERLLKAFLSTDVTNSRLIDMCCGVGALTCFAAKEGLEVFANDLNPSAIACARQNVAQNKIEAEVFNMDAREFVRKLVKDGKLTEPRINHVMINLPEIGIRFLDVFEGLFEDDSALNGNEFRIYCHSFSRENPPEDLRARIPLPLPPDYPIEAVHVRDVAPSKIMYSVEFTVPRGILIRRAKKPRLVE